MDCKSCGAQLREGAKFCSKCGQPVEKGMEQEVSLLAEAAAICPVCKAQLHPGAKFCSKCGTKVGADFTETESTVGTTPSKSREKKGKRTKQSRIAWAIGVLFSVGLLTLAITFVWTASNTLVETKESRWKPQGESAAQKEEEMPEEPDLPDEQETPEEQEIPEESEISEELAEAMLEESLDEDLEEAIAPSEDVEDQEIIEELTRAEYSFVPVSQSYTAVYVKENSDGSVEVTPDLVQTYIPDSTTCYFNETHRLGNDLDEYIKASYSFADLIGRGMDGGISGEGSQQKTDANVCLLVFQWKEQKPYLIGYFVGNMEPAEDGRWCLKVTPCNYDLTPLYEQERESYEKAKEDWLSGEGIFGNYIPPEEVSESGAAYFIKGYNTGKSEDILEDEIQTYHIWYMYHSPYRREIAKKMERYEHYTGRVREGRYQAFLLLDENYEEIGYTVIHGGT